MFHEVGRSHQRENTRQWPQYATGFDKYQHHNIKGQVVHVYLGNTGEWRQNST